MFDLYFYDSDVYHHASTLLLKCLLTVDDCSDTADRTP